MFPIPTLSRRKNTLVGSRSDHEAADVGQTRCVNIRLKAASETMHSAYLDETPTASKRGIASASTLDIKKFYGTVNLHKAAAIMWRNMDPVLQSP